jgi:hypothetical protein
MSKEVIGTIPERILKIAADLFADRWDHAWAGYLRHHPDAVKPATSQEIKTVIGKAGFVPARLAWEYLGDEQQDFDIKGSGVKPYSLYRLLVWEKRRNR